MFAGFFNCFGGGASTDGPRSMVLSGPSGAGKSTMLKMLMKEFPPVFALSVSHTTRGPREGELEGREYHFVNRDQFEKMIEAGDFIEYCEFSGNYYGTSKKAIADVKGKHQICVLDIEKQGVLNVKHTDINPFYIAIKAPSLKSLEERLRARGTEDEAKIQSRMATAEEAMEFCDKPGVFHHVLVNNDVDGTYADLKKILKDEIDKSLRAQASAAAD